MPPKSKLEKAMETPLGAVGATRWLNASEFEAMYNIRRDLIVKLIKRGALQGFKLGRDWRIYNPGWEIANAIRNPYAILENLPLLRSDKAAELLGVPRQRITQWREAKLLNPVRLGHYFYYSVADIRQRADARERWYKKRGISRNTVVEWARKRLNKPTVVDGGESAEKAAPTCRPDVP